MISFLIRSSFITPFALARVPQETYLEEDSRKRGILFLSDLDGTLIDKGSSTALAAWVDYWNREEAPHGSVLCYNTARCIKDYEKLVKQCSDAGVALPTPDVLITGEGTEIRWHKKAAAHSPHRPQAPPPSSLLGISQTFAVDRVWERRIQQQWRDSGTGMRAAAALRRHDLQLIPGLNDKINSPPLGECRFSITTRLGSQGAASLASKLQEELGPTNVHVYSMQGWMEGGDGGPVPEVLACLPKAAGKANAAQYVAEASGFHLEDCVSAGDTMGDASMLTSGMAFICVGNSSTELREMVHTHLGRTAAGEDDEEKEEEGKEEEEEKEEEGSSTLNLERAGGNAGGGGRGSVGKSLRKYFLAQNGFASGAIEGLRHFRNK